MSQSTMTTSESSQTGPQPRRVHHTKMPTLVFEHSEDVDRYVASQIANLIREKQANGEKTVLGLATGSTPIGVYRELIRLHEEEGLDFTNVLTFNLDDEYWPMDPESIHSYHRFMWEKLFHHINISRRNNIPDGTVSLAKIEDWCENYERKIQEAGGLDLQRTRYRTGHIGFNGTSSSVTNPHAWSPLILKHVKMLRATLRRRECPDAGSDDGGQHHERSPDYHAGTR
ncbi:MAG: 6-phosphogluconolactonase [Planctomycetaceae bacterium]